MVKAQNMQQNMAEQGAIPVFQLAILDFLNQAKTPEHIAGTEPQQGPVEDDPGRHNHSDSKGYDIGITVAEKILEHRTKLGGRFTDILQLADIPYFGIDKFNDIVFTFTKLRAPVPSGLGAEFDEYIMAISTLEVAALRLKMSAKDTLSAIRKLFFEQEAPSGKEGRRAKLNWDIVIPGAKNVHPPGEWGSGQSLRRAVDLVARKSSIKIGSKWVNMHALIAGLDARNRPATVDPQNPLTPRLKIASNVEFASFLLGLGNSAYQYMKNFDIGPKDEYSLKDSELATSFSNYSPIAALTAYADAYAIRYDAERSLSWNLLNYYTQAEGPIKTRFQQFAEVLKLGEIKDGLFTNDTLSTRKKLIDKVLSTVFFELEENERSVAVGRMMIGQHNDAGYVAHRLATTYMTDLFIDGLYFQVSMEVSRPIVVSWNRLEARPRTQDFSRTLRAEVRDALWFLSRQWQFGEFKGEDTGSSVEMRVDMETTKINRFSLRGGIAQPYQDAVPMETTVEREPVHLDLTLRQEMGRHFERLLQMRLSESPGAISQSIIDGIKADFRNISSFQFVTPTPAEFYPEVHSDPTLLKIYACIGAGRALDGGALYEAIKTGTPASSFVSSTLDATTLARVGVAATDLLSWFERVYSQPVDAAQSAWNPSQLEYQFQCSAPTGTNATTVLTTTEYANGNLDWYNFDFETDPDNYDPSLTSGSPNISLVNRRLISVLPTDLSFPGMPMPRWWQFEDNKIDLGDIKANTNEVPKLLLAEFALIYSNDWMLLPYDVEVGSLCNIRSVIVKDVFGQYTAVQAAGAGDNTDWQRWSMFNLKRRNLAAGPADNRLFIPPAIVRTMESEPIEQVSLLRDEMANMVWGIEMSIPDGLGGQKEGWDAARRLYDYLVEITPQPELLPPAGNDAQIRYKLGTTVPENWIPFIPVRIGGVNSRQIQLRRAAMPRLVPGRAPERIRPRTELLRTGYNPVSNVWGPYFLHEEEVPRSGVLVSRSWQRSRWINGTVHTWLGRQVRNGRGEANSGLEFDTVAEK